MEKIADTVNAVSATQRTAEECRRKFKDMKSKSMNVKSSEKKTGGGPPPVVPSHHDEVMSILGDSDLVEGINGRYNILAYYYLFSTNY